MSSTESKTLLDKKGSTNRCSPSTGQQLVLHVLFLVNGSFSSTSYTRLHVLPPLASSVHTRSLVCTPELPPKGVHDREHGLQASLNSLQTQSTGQSTMSQNFSFELGPLHSAPPCRGAGLLHSRVLIFFPWHGSSAETQSLHSPHSPQFPGIGQGAFLKSLHSLLSSKPFPPGPSTRGVS